MKIILWYIFLQFLFGHLPLISAGTYPCLVSAMQRELSQMWIFISGVYFWDEVLSFSVALHFPILMLSTDESSVDPYSLGRWRWNRFATTLSLSRVKSVYSRKGVEPFQVTMMLAVPATNFWALLLEVSHLHLFLGSKTAVQLTGSQGLQRWIDPIGFKRNLRCWPCQLIPHLISR